MLEIEEGTRGSLVIDELKHLMEETKVYREQGITIRELADQLKVREYQLRPDKRCSSGNRVWISTLKAP